MGKPTQSFGRITDENLADMAMLCVYDRLWMKELPCSDKRPQSSTDLMEDAAEYVSRSLDAGLGSRVVSKLPPDPDPHTAPYPILYL